VNLLIRRVKVFINLTYTVFSIYTQLE